MYFNKVKNRWLRDLQNGELIILRSAFGLPERQSYRR